MDPAELRAARGRLGLTQHGLAKALRMGKSGWQSVSRWEQDGNTVPGPVAVAVEMMLSRDQTAYHTGGMRMDELRERLAVAIQAELERQWEAKDGRWLLVMPIAKIVLALPEIAEALAFYRAALKDLEQPFGVSAQPDA